MIGGLLDEFIEVLVKMFAVHALKACAGNDVPEMADDSVDEKQLAVFIPVMSPGIRGAVADDFEFFARGMITPDAAVDGCALGFGRAGHTNL